MAVQIAFQITDPQTLMRIPDLHPSAKISDSNLARAVLLGGNGSLEPSAGQRMVFHLHRAMRFNFESKLGPLGTALLLRVPSSSILKS